MVDLFVLVTLRYLVDYSWEREKTPQVKKGNYFQLETKMRRKEEGRNKERLTLGRRGLHIFLEQVTRVDL
jgi:hypothetical protein